MQTETIDIVKKAPALKCDEGTFRGVTTVVKNEANAIAEYLTRIGETNFAGGMEKQP